MSILSHYPHPTFRVGHREVLEHIEKLWDSFDVALVIIPTGGGKTPIRRAISYWYGDTNMTVPTNALLMQELEKYPDTRKILKRKEFYGCDLCYNIDLARVRERGHPILTVPNMIPAHKLGRKLLVVDEGHKLISVNNDMQALNIWHRETPYPLTTYTREQLESFLKLNPMVRNRNKLLEKLATNDYFVRRELGLYRGKGADRLKIIPLTAPLHHALGGKASKIILLSATLNTEDVNDLGVAKGKRVIRIEAPSPIAPARRPIVRSYVGGLSYSNIGTMAPVLAKRVMDISTFHGGRKGLVHVTYGLMEQLRKYISGTRFIFGDRATVKEKLNRWMETKDGILIAAGMEEGLDLSGPEYEFQIITKIQWPSLADPTIRKRAGESKAWYTWQAAKLCFQSYGRICRTPEDEGVTYVLDSTFERLISECRKFDLLPKYITEVL